MGNSVCPICTSWMLDHPSLRGYKKCSCGYTCPSERNTLDTITCKGCGWVHFSVTREYAQNEVDTYMKYYNTFTDEEKSQCGSPPEVSDYEKCKHCGGSHIDFRPSKPGDCPAICTINPILGKDE